ncbi:MAG: hypothetical protein ACYDEY_06440, partial [Acidimicrobiales bacterium]
RAAGLVEDESTGAVFIWGNVAFCWDADDLPARRFAAVQLVVTKVAKPGEVAWAFAVTTTTLWRWKAEFEREGLAGLISTRHGPTGQRVLSKEDIASVKAMRAKGMSLAKIARAMGCSTCPVRQALGLIRVPAIQSDIRDQDDTADEDKVTDNPSTAQEAAEKDQDDAADDEDKVTDNPSTAQEAAEKDQDDAADDEDKVTDNPSAVQEATEKDQDDGSVKSLKPLAQPEPRTTERALARWGLLSEATPVFTEGAGLGRLGTLLILPALR